MMMIVRTIKVLCFVDFRLYGGFRIYHIFMAYRLENDFDYFEDDPASIRAARNPNPLVLISVLKEATRLTNALGPNPMSELSQINRNYSANTYVCGALYCIYNSPLTAATEACLPQNVAILLA